MKKASVFLLMGLIGSIVFCSLPAGAQMGSGHGSPGYYSRGWFCPCCGQYMGPRGYGMMGPGMMGGMMGPGMMMGPGYGYGPGYGQEQKPLEEKDAKSILENYLHSTRNPNLKLGKIKDAGSAFEGEILTKKGNDLVDKILVDKNSGWIRSAY